MLDEFNEYASIRLQWIFVHPIDCISVCLYYMDLLPSKMGSLSCKKNHITGCRYCSFESPTNLLRKFSTMEINSSTFSSCGRWPHCLITSNDAPGMTRESLSAFHEGTNRSLSPVTIRTAQSNKYHQLCSRFNSGLSNRLDCWKEIHDLT